MYIEGVDSIENTILNTQVESPETENTFEMKKFSDIDSQEKQKLRDKIQESGGTMQIWVHSHFEEETPAFFEDLNNEYKEKRAQAIQTGLSSPLPNLALIETAITKGQAIDTSETQKAVERYKKYYGGIAKTGTMYFMETYSNDPTPIGTESPWDSLANELKEVGVEKIIVRGKNLSIRRVSTEDVGKLKDEEKKYIETTPEITDSEAKVAFVPQNCVGETMVNLKSRGFEILTTDLTYPRKMGEIPVLKQMEKQIDR